MSNHASSLDGGLGIRGSDEPGVGRFTPAEAAIRDHYDVLLDGLERFGNYLRTRFVRRGTLEPYIGYWIADIDSGLENPVDWAWRTTLFTYLSFYRFTGVLYLFRAFDKPIDPSSPAYRNALARMQDRKLASTLAACVEGATRTN